MNQRISSFGLMCLMCSLLPSIAMAQDVGDIAGAGVNAFGAIVAVAYGLTGLAMVVFWTIFIILAVVVGLKQYRTAKDSNKGQEYMVTFLLWFFLGWLGIHRVYNRDMRGLIIGALYITGIITAFVFVGGILIVGVLIFILTDLFRLPAIVDSGIEKRNATQGSKV